MPILTIQRRMRELGRIRLGVQVPVKGRPGVMRPEKLSTFRVTSASRELVQAVADYYGKGEVGTWDSPRGPEAETVITSPYLDVIVPPGEVVDPWMEMWSGGGCVRRCDGVTEQLAGVPCMCPADPKTRQELAAKGKACKATTRLNVALPAIPDLGVWRLETHSYYAAVELTGAAEVLRQATEQGVMIRARLRIDHRQVRRPGEPTKDFIVPVIELPDLRLDNLIEAGPITGGPRQLASGAPAARALPAAPALPERSSFRPAPSAAAAPAAEEPVEGAFVPIDEDADAPGASVEVRAVEVKAQALSLEGYKLALHQAGIGGNEWGEYRNAIKQELYGDLAELDDEQRGRLAAECIRRRDI